MKIFVRLRFLRSFVVISVLLVTSLTAAGSPVQSPQPPRRIISLIPAVTEMLFAIGAGDQVVAVSSFDRFPPEVSKLQRVGALLDPDIERILALHPDLVIVYASQSDLRAQLDRAKIATFVYRHAGLADVTVTLKEIGERVGHGRDAENVTRSIEARMAAVRTRVAGRMRPRTLIVFDRETLTLRGIYASGGIGFIHEMVDIAGGENVFSDVKQEAVQGTTELILARRPEAILELRGDPIGVDIKAKEIDVWRALGSLPAVRNSRVYFLDQQKTVVPGPRVAEGVELIAHTLHPDAFK
jgi:iron complex transport system substrate-binding protein